MVLQHGVIQDYSTLVSMAFASSPLSASISIDIDNSLVVLVAYAIAAVDLQETRVGPSLNLRTISVQLELLLAALIGVAVLVERDLGWRV